MKRRDVVRSLCVLGGSAAVGRDLRGRSLPSGMYFCRLEAGSLRLVHKMSLVR